MEMSLMKSTTPPAEPHVSGVAIQPSFWRYGSEYVRRSLSMPTQCPPGKRALKPSPKPMSDARLLRAFTTSPPICHGFVYQQTEMMPLSSSLVMRMTFEPILAFDLL